MNSTGKSGIMPIIQRIDIKDEIFNFYFIVYVDLL